MEPGTIAAMTAIFTLIRDAVDAAERIKEITGSEKRDLTQEELATTFGRVDASFSDFKRKLAEAQGTD